MTRDTASAFPGVRVVAYPINCALTQRCPHPGAPAQGVGWPPLREAAVLDITSYGVQRIELSRVDGHVAEKRLQTLCCPAALTCQARGVPEPPASSRQRAESDAPLPGGTLGYFIGTWEESRKALVHDSRAGRHAQTDGASPGQNLAVPAGDELSCLEDAWVPVERFFSLEQLSAAASPLTGMRLDDQTLGSTCGRTTAGSSSTPGAERSSKGSNRPACCPCTAHQTIAMLMRPVTRWSRNAWLSLWPTREGLVAERYSVATGQAELADQLPGSGEDQC